MEHRMERESRTLRLVFPGDILSTNAVTLKEQMLAVLTNASLRQEAWDLVEMDLSAAKMVDSVGLNLLVTLMKVVQQKNKRIRIRTATSHVRRALKFTRLDQMAEVIGA